MDSIFLDPEGFIAGARSLALWFWNEGHRDLFGTLLWWVLTVLVGWLGLPKLFRRLRHLWADPMETALKQYHGRLDDSVEKLGHKFAKGLPLSQILVPVSVEALPTNNDTKPVRGNPGGTSSGSSVSGAKDADKSTIGSLKLGVDNLSAILIQIFAGAASTPAGGASGKRAIGAPFVVITGEPGSGKTVALKVAALEGWDLPRPAALLADRRQLVPVLLTFKEWYEAGLHLPDAITKAIVQVLRKEQAGRPSVRADGTERTDPVAEWVCTALCDGRLLVLIDGLDELEILARAKAASALSEAVDTWRQTPFVVTCRTEAWRDLGVDEHPRRTWLRMQPFNEAAIRQFVRRWRFAPAELAERLLAGIRNQAHLSELARNPLTLTILCWLYESRHGEGAPANRAKFYEECCDQLLEQWDLKYHKIKRTQFTKKDKASFLAFFFWHHMAQPLLGEKPDRESEKGSDGQQDSDMTVLWTEKTARQWGARRGLSPHDVDILVESLQIEDGIASTLPEGILAALPPDKLTFSHRTFMEYFAALYLSKEKPLDDMVRLFSSDPGRWQQVLLFYCGLCTQSIDVSRIVDALIDRDQIGLALTALSETELADPEVAARSLGLARGALMADFKSEIVRGLGDLLACPRADLSQQASELLDYLLERAALRPAERWAVQLQEMARALSFSESRSCLIPNVSERSEWLAVQLCEAAIAEGRRLVPLPIHVLRDLVLTMLRRPSALLKENLPQLLRRLNPESILPAMHEDDVATLSAGVMRVTPEPSSGRKGFRLEWIDGLRRAGALPILFNLEAESWSDTQLDHAIAVALARSSITDDRFWALADEQPERRGMSAEEIAADERWGWPYQPPIEQQGKGLCCRIARNLSQDCSWAARYLDIDIETDIDTRLKYLALARGVEARSDPNEGGFDCSWAIGSRSPDVLRAIWMRAAKVRGANSGLRVNDRGLAALRTMGLALNVMLAIVLVSPLLLQPLGFSDLGVGWPSVFSGLFVLIGVMSSGAMVEATEGAWPYDTDGHAFTKLAVQPSITLSLFTHVLVFALLSAVSWIVGLISERNDDWIRPWPSASSFLRAIATILSSAVPLAFLAGFAAGGVGHGLLPLLSALALVNPLYLLTYSAEATHPLYPSNKTLHLIDLLSRVQAMRRSRLI